MKLNNTSQYAIKILIYMVNNNSQKLFSAKQISEQLSIPYKYMTRVMSQLVDAGLLVSIRGREGGYRLEKKLSEITILDILNAVNESINSHTCILGDKPCDENQKCALHDLWVTPKKSMTDMFKNTTLEMLSKTENSFSLS